jgi:hypothetical protein
MILERQKSEKIAQNLSRFFFSRKNLTQLDIKANNMILVEIVSVYYLIVKLTRQHVKLNNSK